LVEALFNNKPIVMKRKTIMDPKVIELYRAYLEDALDRREFIRKLAVLAGSTAAACTLLSLLEGGQAQAAIVPKDDSRLHTEYVQYPGATGQIRAYLARHREEKKLPGVVVIHENRGLNDHIEDVARRTVLEGFLSLAPDALTAAGGTPEDPDKARTLIGQLDQPSTVKNFTAAVQYLKTHPMSSGKVGVVGFCWGGAMANQVAVNSPDLAAAVPYYGRQPKPEEVSKIEAPLLLHYAGEDEGINKGIPAFEEALKKANVEYKVYMYEGAKHAFNNDQNAERYDKEAARLAWQRTISFLKEKLKP